VSDVAKPQRKRFRRRKRPRGTVAPNPALVARAGAILDRVVDKSVEIGQVGTSTARSFRAMLGLLVGLCPMDVSLAIDGERVLFRKEDAHAVGMTSIAAYAASLCDDAKSKGPRS
jgi:hypothetical protein